MDDPRASRPTISVEVAYALPDHQELVAVQLATGATVLDAIERSGILGRHPEIALGPGRVGVFGKIAALDAALRDGDRVEIYRPLIVEPKAARRARAESRKRR